MLQAAPAHYRRGFQLSGCSGCCGNCTLLSPKDSGEQDMLVRLQLCRTYCTGHTPNYMVQDMCPCKMLYRFNAMVHVQGSSVFEDPLLIGGRMCMTEVGKVTHRLPWGSCPRYGKLEASSLSGFVPNQAD